MIKAKFLLFVVAVCAILALAGPMSLAGTMYVYNVMDYGATGNGTTDDTSAFQQALNAAGVTGGTVWAPRGCYKIATHLSIPSHVTLEGETGYPLGYYVQQSGSALLASEGRDNGAASPFISMSAHSTLKGITVDYPDQNNSSSIHSYPWTIRGNGANIAVIDDTLCNPWNGVDFATYACSRHYIRGLYGQPLGTGISISGSTEMGRIENVHFWPFWDSSDAALNFTRANSYGLTFGRADNECVQNTFTFGYFISYYFYKDAGGVSAYGSFSGISADDSIFPMYFVGASPNGIHISNGQFVSIASSGNPIGMYVANSLQSDGVITLTNCSFWGAMNFSAYTCAGNVSLIGCNFRDWNPSYYALESDGGRLTVNGCYFQSSGNRIRLGPAATGGVVTSNRGVSTAQISNSCANTAIANNTP